MTSADRKLPRLRQAVLAAEDLDRVAGRMRDELGLGEPFADPGVGYFGLRNAVFALGDTFLEVVSPTREDTAAGRLLERRGGDCGYMLMFQVGDLDAARRQVEAHRVREVFEVSLDEMSEVHLHPGDMRGAIVSLSSPEPPASWRWGGPEWERRSAPLELAGATVAVADDASVRERWSAVLGVPVSETGVMLVCDPAEPGLIEIKVGLDNPRDPVEIAGLRFVFVTNEEEQ